MNPPKPQCTALYGGTFDPIHLGHLEVAKAARQQLNLDRVEFTPCARSPFKDTGPVATDEQRCEMIRLTTADLPWAELNRFELEGPAPSFTYQTLEDLACRRPDDDLFLIIGEDHLAAFDHWRNYREILKKADLIVINRPGEDLPTPPFLPSEKLHRLEGNHPASASELRQALAQNALTPAHESWLNPGVLHLAQNQQIYASAPS